VYSAVAAAGIICWLCTVHLLVGLDVDPQRRSEQSVDVSSAPSVECRVGVIHQRHSAGHQRQIRRGGKERARTAEDNDNGGGWPICFVTSTWHVTLQIRELAHELADEWQSTPCNLTVQMTSDACAVKESGKRHAGHDSWHAGAAAATRNAGGANTTTTTTTTTPAATGLFSRSQSCCHPAGLTHQQARQCRVR